MISASPSIAKIGKARKEEIAARPIFALKDKLAFLSALIISSGSLIIHGNGVSVTVSTENEKLEECLSALVSETTGKECKVTQKGRRREIIVESALGLLCACKVLERDNGIKVCEHIAEEFCEEQSAAAYIRGAYLGAGSLSAGKYHLEFSFGRKSIAQDFSQMLSRFGIDTRLAVRGTRAVVYAKDGESISDCLALMGAPKAVLALNEIMAQRLMREHINRQQNCDMHNIDKQITTGLNQCAFLRELDTRELSETLRETVEARLKFPEYSYEQLGTILGISKSGLKNRLRRLQEIYSRMNDKEKKENGI